MASYYRLFPVSTLATALLVVCFNQPLSSSLPLIYTSFGKQALLEWWVVRNDCWQVNFCSDSYVRYFVVRIASNYLIPRIAYWFSFPDLIIYLSVIFIGFFFVIEILHSFLCFQFYFLHGNNFIEYTIVIEINIREKYSSVKSFFLIRGQ